MVKLCRMLVAFLAPLLALAVISSNAHATTVVMLTDLDLIASSRVIVTGTVRGVFSAWDDDRSTIWTYVEITPDRILKGQLPSDLIVLKQPGGVVGSTAMRVLGQPLFGVGRHVLLYLNVASDRSLHVAHCFMGMFSIVEDPASGTLSVERWNDSENVDRIPGTEQSEVTDRAPLNQYLRRIRDVLRTQVQASGVADYDAVPAEYSRKKEEASGYSPDFVLQVGGVRWMDADNGQPMVFLLNPNQAPIAGGAVAELSRAMTAWTAQSGANIQLQLGAQTSLCGQALDNVSVISFADCHGQLDPPIGCSGVLAVTTIGFTSETKTVSGQPFKRLVEADLVFNKGMDCFLGISANMAGVSCHELGHALGLAHSTDPAAIMWGSARAGRDAVLGSDDIAGVRYIYPPTTGGGGGGGGIPPTPVSITSLTLPGATQGQRYQETLSATGGTPPYSWRVFSGQMPPGLSLTTSGLISGTPSEPGFFSISVLVVDSSQTSPSSDAKAISLNITSQPSSAPVIAGVHIKGSKKLQIFGQGFRIDSIALINGVSFSPKSLDSDGATQILFCKGKLHLGPAGTNVVQVFTSDNRSAPFSF